VELAAWWQIAQDPAGFAASLQVCPGAAADLAVMLREQLQLDRLPSSMRIGCAIDKQRLQATIVPENPTMWSFHALCESSVCLSPNDSRLHEALQKPSLGGYDLAHSQWLSSTLHADLANSVTTAAITIPQWQSSKHDTSSAPAPAQVWIAEDPTGNWRLIAVSGPAQSWGHDAGHVNSRRPSRFLPAEFRWTETNR